MAKATQKSTPKSATKVVTKSTPVTKAVIKPATVAKATPKPVAATKARPGIAQAIREILTKDTSKSVSVASAVKTLQSKFSDLGYADKYFRDRINITVRGNTGEFSALIKDQKPVKAKAKAVEDDGLG